SVLLAACRACDGRTGTPSLTVRARNRLYCQSLWALSVRGELHRRRRDVQGSGLASNRSLLWAQLLRSGAYWALRQILGVLAIVVSIVLLLALTSAAETRGTRFGWPALA